MADVSVKMGVSGISQFKQGMNEAQASVKTFDAALKANEKALKASGDAENYLQAQTTVLKGKLQAQQKIVKNAEQALEQMRKNGVKETSTEFQNMQRRLIEAQSGILDTQMDLEKLGTEAQGAADKTDKLSSSLGGIGKKMSLDQVISGIGSITNAMEKAGKKAIELGKQIWDNITDAAKWADDASTQAMILNMDVEDYQRYKKVFDQVGEITVAEWQKAKQKVQKAINDPTQEQTDIMSLLGINTHEMSQGKYGIVEGAAKDFESVFWEIGRTLREKVANGEMTQDMADVYANAMFGKGFAELNPMFKLGEEGFQQALDDQEVVSKKAVENLSSLNDQLIKLQGDFETLKIEILGEIAPALEGAAKAVDGMLSSLLAYLKTPEGKQALEDMGKAVEGLFQNITEIDPQEVVSGFAEVFDKVVGGLTWLSENSGTVIGAMEAIVAGWGLLKLTGGILEVWKVIQGVMGLAGGTGAASAAGAATGGAWGAAFAKAVLAAAPWLIGLYTLLKPAGTAGAELDQMYANGHVTQAGWEYWTNNQEEWNGRVAAVGNRFGDLGSILNNEAALNIIGNLELSDEEVLAKLQEELGLVPIDGEIQLPDDQKDQLEEEIGTLDIPGRVYVDAVEGGGHKHGRGNQWNSNANGIWSVPFDGYGAILHKGERVIPAREVSSRSYNSNLYVESMYMNSGTDAEGLAAAMAAAQRRTMSGFGN